MTRTSVADAMPIATRLQEYLSLFRTWLSNKVRYEFVMSIIVMFLNVTAIVFLYMKDHKIPFPEDNIYFQSCVLFLVLFTMLSCLAWSSGIFKVKAYYMYILGCICHIFGSAISLHLLYVISPPLALLFAVPCSIDMVTILFNFNGRL